MGKRIDISGKRFGRLFIKTPVRKPEYPNLIFWECVCDCGTICVKRASDLLNGDTKSCGCLKKELTSKRLKKHGISGNPTPEYRSWLNIKDRCNNPKNQSYSYYGGRGISIYKKWNDSFECFLNDVGIRPSKLHSADRFPNNNGNYEPGNFRWATKKEQANNMRSNRHIEYNGINYTIQQFAELFGVSHTLVLYFERKGYSSAYMAKHFVSPNNKLKWRKYSQKQVCKPTTA